MTEKSPSDYLSMAFFQKRGSWAKPQYCSFNDPYPRGDVNAAGMLPLPWAQVVVAHLALHSAEVDSIAARTDAFLKDLVQHHFMKDFLLPRGE